MAAVLYCGVCTMPPEYCRYHNKYNKCLEWMKQNQPDLFQEEIKDLQDRDPKTYKKTQHLWDENAAQPSQDEEKKPTKDQTKTALELEKKVNFQQQNANEQLADIQSKLDQLSTSSTSPQKNNNKSILKNRQNPNYKQEQQNLNDSQLNSDNEENEEEIAPNDNYLGRGGNLNRRGGPPPRKDTKKRKRKKQRGGRKKRGGRQDEDEEDEDEENKQEESEQQQREDKQKMVKFMEQNKNRKIPKNIVEVSLENRKGNKRVTVVRGFIEKSKDKEQRIKSEFMKKFATSVNITFQNPGSDKGPKQVVLMGDKRYDFMKYLKDKFPKAGKLLYYKTKKFGLTPAVDPDHGFVMPPP